MSDAMAVPVDPAPVYYWGMFVLVWIVFEIGILAYRVFVAKGSFRPKPAIPEYEDEDDNEDGDDEPTIDITTEEIPDETPAIPESEINE